MKDLVNKLGEILEGWKNVAFENKTIENLAFERAKICAVCPFNEHNTCTKCGCPLVAKTRSPKSKCPEGKW